MEQALTVYRHMLEIYVDALDIHTDYFNLKQILKIIFTML